MRFMRATRPGRARVFFDVTETEGRPATTLVAGNLGWGKTITAPSSPSSGGHGESSRGGHSSGGGGTFSGGGEESGVE